MANRRFAVVKKDPASSYSTGGVVVELKDWPENSADRVGTVFDLNASYNDGNNYELVPCATDVEIGWIYKDKSHEFWNSDTNTKSAGE